MVLSFHTAVISYNNITLQAVCNPFGAILHLPNTEPSHAVIHLLLFTFLSVSAEERCFSVQLAP